MAAIVVLQSCCAAMKISVNRLSGPYYPLVVMALLMLAILSFSRLGLFIWQYERVAAAADILPLLLQIQGPPHDYLAYLIGNFHLATPRSLCRPL